MSIFNKLLNWFRPAPRWEDFHVEPVRWPWPKERIVRNEQWRTNFSLTAAQRSERSRKAAATRKANKAKSNGE
ncbi:hypothetical protein [Tardibacter chloracetimidivorans]|uniref:hypothetical protein n=1 Tax=Tardibacter chloracetimidivorans TaxID=1921510 RepID=UPI001300F77F|nr:hypothetical protein [Tardibacter chloracetimidivorans]